MPLSKFLKSDRMLKALRKGVAAMKARKAYDPFSWFYQAAIHGVLPAVAEEEGKKLAAISDEDGAKFEAVFQKRYWNQCPHNGEEAANFLPWHRAYTYYFERILRLHTEDDDFSLPFWDYEDKANRKFPKEFGEPFVDGDPKQPNPLFMAERDFYFTRYDHPFAVGLPLLELTDDAVDSSGTLASPVFFGNTEREGIGGGFADEDSTTRGLMESRPHDHIHRAVGGIIIQPDGKAALGAMSQPPTAGFDPIFPMHHSNIDRLWAVWSCMPNKDWGKRPPNYWFNERAWFFWDVGADKMPLRVNEPRKNYFSHRALSVTFEGEDPNCKPLELPAIDTQLLAEVASPRQRLEVVAEHQAEFALLSAGRTAVSIPSEVKSRLALSHTALRMAKTQSAARGIAPAPGMLLRLVNLDLGFVPATGFDVHITQNAAAPLRRTDPSFVGSVALFRHERRLPAIGAAAHSHISAAGAPGAGDSFDITDAVTAMSETEVANLKVVIVPYSLLTVPGKETVYVPAALPARASGIQFLMAR